MVLVGCLEKVYVGSYCLVVFSVRSECLMIRGCLCYFLLTPGCDACSGSSVVSDDPLVVLLA